MASEERKNTGPVDRLQSPALKARLAYRVARELTTLRPDYVVAAPETSPDDDELESAQSDFIVQHLDLRMRLILLPNIRDGGDLQEDVVNKLAQETLTAWPETSAVIVVANDSDLSSVVFEPYDRSEAVIAPKGTPGAAGTPAVPLADSLRAYLDTNIVTWDDPMPNMQNIDELDLQKAAGAAVKESRGATNKQRAVIVEKKQALRDVSDRDEAWALETVMNLLTGAYSQDRLRNEVRSYLEDPDD